MGKLESYQGNHFGFSAVPISELESTEYTLVCIAVDKSYSTTGFTKNLEQAITKVIEDCQHSPRADNLLVRVISFSDDVEEVHGFDQLSDINLSNYVGKFKPQGMTALRDAFVSSIESVQRYGEDLTEQDYLVNGIVVVITDGEENRSKSPESSPQKLIEDIKRSEKLESILTILVGINTHTCSQSLKSFSDKHEIDHYIDAGQMTDKQFAKVAQFVSQSVSSQSQSLGTGMASQSISF